MKISRSVSLVSFEPAAQDRLRKREPVHYLLRQAACAVGDGNLDVMAVERPEVEVLRALDEIRPHEQPLGEDPPAQDA